MSRPKLLEVYSVFLVGWQPISGQIWTVGWLGHLKPSSCLDRCFSNSAGQLYIAAERIGQF